MKQGNNSIAWSARAQVLLAEDLRKSYKNRPALRGLSFSLQAGRILGFLGPNGAGKTTAIRILTTILEPDSGSFVVGGISSEYPMRIRSKIGVLPESLGFPKQASALELLTYFGGLYGKTHSDAKSKALALLEEVGLQKRAKSQIGTYSRGMRQRLGIARALINDPIVVFLDEPTLGLDPRGHQELLELVRYIADERKAGIILCSHLLTEIEGICDDVVILNSGQIVAKGTVAEIIGQSRKNGVSKNAFRVRVSQDSLSAARQALEAMKIIKKVSTVGAHSEWLGVELAAQDDGVYTDDALIKNKIMEALIKAEIPILGIEAEGGRLQDVFFQLTEEGIQ